MPTALESQTDNAQFNVFVGLINCLCWRRKEQRKKRGKNPRGNKEKCILYTLSKNYNIEFDLS